MTAYVDDQLRDASVRNGVHVVHGRWSRLFADATAELLAFGERLGLSRSWLRQGDSPLEHFDVTAGKRRLAIALGAVEISADEAHALARARRVGAHFDLKLLRADPQGFEDALAMPARPAMAEGPVRVQLSRARGFRLPPGTVSVAAPTRWANPYRPAARTPEANAAAVEHFRGYLARNPVLVELARAELAGLNLACWCQPALPCHADVWLAIVNRAEGNRPA